MNQFTKGDIILQVIDSCLNQRQIQVESKGRNKPSNEAFEQFINVLENKKSGIDLSWFIENLVRLRSCGTFDEICSAEELINDFEKLKVEVPEFVNECYKEIQIRTAFINSFIDGKKHEWQDSQIKEFHNFLENDLNVYTTRDEESRVKRLKKLFDDTVIEIEEAEKKVLKEYGYFIRGFYEGDIFNIGKSELNDYFFHGEMKKKSINEFRSLFKIFKDYIDNKNKLREIRKRVLENGLLKQNAIETSLPNSLIGSKIPDKGEDGSDFQKFLLVLRTFDIRIEETYIRSLDFEGEYEGVVDVSKSVACYSIMHQNLDSIEFENTLKYLKEKALIDILRHPASVVKEYLKALEFVKNKFKAFTDRYQQKYDSFYSPDDDNDLHDFEKNKRFLSSLSFDEFLVPDPYFNESLINNYFIGDIRTSVRLREIYLSKFERDVKTVLGLCEASNETADTCSINTYSGIGKGRKSAVNEELELSSFFADISKYNYIMNLLVSKGYCQPGTFIWKDEGAGNKGLLAAIMKCLHAQKYYKEKKRPTSEQMVIIARNTFGWSVSLDTVKKSKPDHYQLDFIPPSTTIG